MSTLVHIKNDDKKKNIWKYKYSNIYDSPDLFTTASIIESKKLLDYNFINQADDSMYLNHNIDIIYN